MALFGLPLASLILGVPLGVDLAYLNAASKTDTSGTSQIVASGIRLELSQALKAEYAAFAEADKAVIAKALEEEMETWKAERPKEEDPTLGSRAIGALGAVIAAPITLPVAAVSLGVRGAISLSEAISKLAIAKFNTYKAVREGDAQAAAAAAQDEGTAAAAVQAAAAADALAKGQTDAPAAADAAAAAEQQAEKQTEVLKSAASGVDAQDKPSGAEPPAPPGAASTIGPKTKEDTLNDFIGAVIGAMDTGNTKELVEAIKKGPFIVAQPFEGRSALQMVIEAAIKDSADIKTSPGFFKMLRSGVSAALSPIGNAAGKASQIASAALSKANKTLNPFAIAKRRKEEAELLNPVYGDGDGDGAAMTGGATMKQWAAVVTQILRTPYVYEDDALEAAIAALNDRIKKEATFETAKINTLAAGPARGLPMQKEELAETELEGARDILMMKQTEAIAARKATPRPMAAFNDLIAMNGVEEADRERTAEVLVPVLNAFMWWRWNVLHFPLSYTVEQVVDAQHLLDGLTAETDVPLPFFNASVTLRRDINEKKGLELTPEQEKEKRATAAAVAAWEQGRIDSANAAKERAAAAAEEARAAAAPPAVPLPLSPAAALQRSSEYKGTTPFSLQVSLPPPAAAPAAAAPAPPPPPAAAPAPLPLSNASAMMRSSEPRGHTPFSLQVPLPPPAAPLPLSPAAAAAPAAASNEKIVTPEQLATRKAVRERKKQIDRVTYNTVPDDERSKKEHQGRLNLLITALAGEKDNVRRADEAANAAPAAEADAAAQAAADLEAAAAEAARVAEARAAAAAVDAQAAARAARMRGVTFVDQQVAAAAAAPAAAPAAPPRPSPPPGSSPAAAQPDALPNPIAAANPEKPISDQASGGKCKPREYTDSRRKLISALSQRNLNEVKENWRNLLDACGDSTPPPESVTAFNNAKTDAEKTEVMRRIIATLVGNGTITQVKANELLAVKAGKRRRRKTSKRRRAGKGGKSRKSTFRRHRKH